MKGHYFDIKKFAIHDGPGIRSTLFLKGCPLNCVWCQNPEGIDYEAGLWFFHNSCIQCGQCVSDCPEGALSKEKARNPFIAIDRESCIKCGICVEACPTTALSFDSSLITVDEAVEKLMQDQLFYGESGGGITISGGDPLFQHQFSKEVLKRCREQGVHTVIETSMQASEDILRGFIGLVDLFIVDLKIMNDGDHRNYIGVGNKQIHSNFAMLVKESADLMVRIPLIPGITARDENIEAIALFIREHSSRIPVELINFNPLAVNKYRLMNKDNQLLQSMKPFTEGELNHFYSILEREGLPIIREKKIEKEKREEK